MPDWLNILLLNDKFSWVHGQGVHLSYFQLELGYEDCTFIDQAIEFGHGLDYILIVKKPEVNASFDEPDAITSSVI